MALRQLRAHVGYDTDPGGGVRGATGERAPIQGAHRGPPLLAAAVLVPLTVYVGLQFALLLFLVMLLWRLFAVPELRRRANRRVIEDNPKWQLRPDQ